MAASFWKWNIWWLQIIFIFDHRVGTKISSIFLQSSHNINSPVPSSSIWQTWNHGDHLFHHQENLHLKNRIFCTCELYTQHDTKTKLMQSVSTPVLRWVHFPLKNFFATQEAKIICLQVLSPHNLLSYHAIALLVPIISRILPALANWDCLIF